MHYYKRNLGDYAKKAGRLSMLQHGAYTLLIDACYDREFFPTEQEAFEWTWASTPEEEQAVRFVLSRFFVLQENGTYLQQRIDEELKIYKIGDIQNRLIALSREARKKKREALAKACDQLRAEIKHDPLRETHEAWTLLLERVIKQHETAPNQEPLTTNQEPLTTNQEPLTNINNTRDKSPAPPDNKIKKFTPEQQALAKKMAGYVCARIPSQKINIEEWSDAVRKLIEIDNHDEAEILALWDWIDKHKRSGFSWADNCRTPMKLREKKDGLSYFDIIFQQMAREIQAECKSKSRDKGNIGSTRNNSLLHDLTNTDWAQGV